MLGFIISFLAAIFSVFLTPWAVPGALPALPAAITYPHALDLSATIEGCSVTAAGEIYAVNQTSFYSLSAGPGAPNTQKYFGGGLPDSYFASSRFTRTLGPLVGDAIVHAVWRSDKNGSWSTLFRDERMLQPNDMTVSGDERFIYFSGMSYTATTFAGVNGDLWVYDVYTNDTHPVDPSVLKKAGIHRTNGIELSPDDKFLYITSAENLNGAIVSTKVFKFTIGENGIPRSPVMEVDLYVALSEIGYTDAKAQGMDPDGMRIDVEGNLFVSLNAYQKVLKYNINTKKSQVIALPTVAFPSNLELGGTEGKDLVIVGRCNGGAASCVDLYKNDAVGFNPSSPGTAAAHGYVKQHVLDGVYYTGFEPYGDPDFDADAPSIVRKIYDIGPIKTPLEANITCNQNAVPIVGKTGPIHAGTDIIFRWSEWPIMTYMAKCDPDCGSFWGTEGDVWFKIDEYGWNNDTRSWATQKLFDDGNTWTSTVPECLAPGEYLVRHEIISVSEASKAGGAQFYPSCAQVQVIGNGTVNPEGVALPGAYSPTDPGILFNTNLYFDSYTVPGPAVFTCPQ
ncbi:hypothetical protein RUND412_005831 [Rhizina undulata]